jgi:hypothetical protein
MQKVRSYFYLTFTRAAYKTTISNLSFTVLFTVAYILYLVLEEGSPIFKQVLPVLLVCYFSADYIKIKRLLRY